MLRILHWILYGLAYVAAKNFLRRVWLTKTPLAIFLQTQVFLAIARRRHPPFLILSTFVVTETCFLLCSILIFILVMRIRCDHENFITHRDPNSPDQKKKREQEEEEKSGYKIHVFCVCVCVFFSWSSCTEWNARVPYGPCNCLCYLVVLQLISFHPLRSHSDWKVCIHCTMATGSSCAVR